MPRDGAGSGPATRLGDHAGREVARRNGAVREAFGETKGGKAGSAAEVEDGPAGRIPGKRIEQMESGVLQMGQPSRVVAGREPVVAARDVGGPDPAVPEDQAGHARVEARAIHVALDAHGDQTGPQPAANSAQAIAVKIQATCTRRFMEKSMS